MPKIDEGEHDIERSDIIDHANHDSLWNYYIKPFDYEESDQLEHEEIVRAKRLITPLQTNIGCVKGYRCCHNPRCRPFCSLCNRYGYSKYACLGTFENVSRNFTLLGYGPTHENFKKKCKKGRENSDGTCDDEDDYDESDKEKADPDDDNDEDYDESDEEKADPDDDSDEDDDYDESDEEKADPNDNSDEDYDESDEEKGGTKNDTNVYGQNANSHPQYNESSDNDQVHLTYHVYEEYLPTSTAPPPSYRQDRATPIILQNTPQYSVFNYYSLMSPNAKPQQVQHEKNPIIVFGM